MNKKQRLIMIIIFTVLAIAFLYWYFNFQFQASKPAVIATGEETAEQTGQPDRSINLEKPPFIKN